MNLRICSFILLAGALSAQQLPPPPKAHLADVTPKAGFFNEPAIAVNAKDALQLAVAWQVNASVAYSSDGGQNWTTATGTAPKDYRVSGDVSITFDAAGHAILCYIAFDKLGTTNYWAQGATRNGVFLRRSFHCGRTWGPNSATVFAHRPLSGIPFV